MWDDEDWRSPVIRVPQEMRDDEANDPEVQHPIVHRRRRRLQHRSRFRELFGTALHRIGRIRRSRCNLRDNVLLQRADVSSIIFINTHIVLASVYNTFIIEVVF